MDFRTIQQSLVGKFHRTDYDYKFITIKLIGDLSADILTQEQTAYIKTFYNRPDAELEILSNKTIRLNC